MIPIPGWLLGGMILIGPAVWGYMYVQSDIQSRMSYNRGIVAGRAEIAAAQIVEATKTQNAIRDAQLNPPIIPTDKTALKLLCKRSQSCRDRLLP